MSLEVPIAVAVVDDNRLVREGLAAILNRLPDIRATVYADTEAAMAAGAHADVMLLDVGFDGDETLRIATTLLKRAPDMRIIVMDLLPAAEEILDLVSAGVSGFVLKDASLDEFVATVRAVAAGDRVLPSRTPDSLFTQIADDARRRKGQDVLDDVRMTPRELEVIELIGEGLSNKEIAQRLDIAAHTVKSHVRNVMEKLALHTRLQIAAYFRR